MLYCIKTPENRILKSFVVKYVKDIEVSSHTLQGTFSIKNIRFYKYTVEIDVLYKGKIFGRRGGDKNNWLSSDILKEDRVSKVRVNKMIRKALLSKLESRLELFDITLRHYSYIKTLKWI